MNELKGWLEEPVRERWVEPNSRLGQAFQYLLNQWETLTQFLRVPGTPRDNNTVERALKLMIRQRRNRLFYASTHSAYGASVLPIQSRMCSSRADKRQAAVSTRGHHGNRPCDRRLVHSQKPWPS